MLFAGKSVGGDAILMFTCRLETEPKLVGDLLRHIPIVTNCNKQI
jgi:hypothetical protein